MPSKASRTPGGYELVKLLPQVRKSVEARDWGISADEVEWIMKRVARRVTEPSEPNF